MEHGPGRPVPRAGWSRLPSRNRTATSSCVTEGFAGIQPDVENVVKGTQIWGYPVRDDRRKVLLWSKRSWTDIDLVGSRGCRVDHRIWLEEFRRLQPHLPPSRTVVLGHFNQSIPRRRVRGAPEDVYRALLDAFDGLEIATAGELAVAPRLSIDHIAHIPDLTAGEIRIWPGEAAGGRRLSNHFGVWSDVRLR